MSGLTVLIVDDHPVFRRGLRLMLDSQPWVEAVVEAATVQEVSEMVNTHTIGAAVMDLRLPDGDGLQATRRLLARQPDVRVLVLTMSEDKESVAQALDAGAHGYMVKQSDPEVIVDALHTVALGGLVLGPQVSRSALIPSSTQGHLAPPLDRLTQRELDVLTLLATGVGNAVIAKNLHVSEKTVRNQLSTIFVKLGVSDRLQAALLARDHGVGVPVRE